MNGSGDHHAEQDKPSSKGQLLHVFAHMWNLDNNNNNNNNNGK
jgi:hypothetical protein